MEQYYWAALAALLGYQAPQKMKYFLSHFGTAKQALQASPQELAHQGLLTAGQARNWDSQMREDLPERLYTYCETHGVTILTLLDDSYPELLRHIADPPPVLYVKGTLTDTSGALAIVGSRKATPYGLGNAEHFAAKLAGRGISIISGGAYGIDAAAHTGALKAHGTTVAVLGGGFEHLYPSDHVRLFDKICSQGALITEFTPWTESLALHFPLRNRIIVGLSKGVLVVEAAVKSGAMITAHLAADENRDVYAIPGPISSPVSKGTHKLIQEGARLVTTPEQVAALLQGQLTGQEPEEDGASLFPPDPVKTDPLQEELYQWLSRQGQSHSLESIAEHFPQSLAQLNMAALELELAGKIRKGPADRYYVV